MKRLGILASLFFGLTCTAAFAWNVHGTGNLPQAQQFFNRVPSLTDPARMSWYNTMIGTMLACPNGGGNAYAALDALYVFDAPSTTIADTNIISSSFPAVLHNSPTFTANVGYTGNGSNAVIDTQLAPSAGGTNYSLDAGSIGVYILTSRATTSGLIFDLATDFGSDLSAIWTDGNAGMIGNINIQAESNRSAVANTQGSWVDTIGGGATLQTQTLYLNGAVTQSVPLNAAGLDTVSFQFLGNATSGFGFSSDQIAAGFIGGNLTASQVSCVSNAINTFIAHDGNNVYAASNNFPPFANTSLASIFSGEAGSSLPILGVSSHLSTGVQATLNNLTWAGGTATATTADNMGITNGTNLQMTLSGVTPSSLDATFSATITGPNTFTFSVANPGTISFPGFYQQVIPATTNASLASAIGAQLLRTDLSWELTDPAGNGTDSFTWLDPLVTAVSGAGLTAELAFDYGNAQTGCFFGGPTTGNSGLTPFEAFVTNAVTHYGATGMLYEIWNEENLGAASPGVCTSGASTYAWAPFPNAADYSALLTGTASAAHTANSSTSLISGGLTFSAGAGYITPNSFIGTVVADATLTNVAGFGYHPYPGGVQVADNPENMIANIASFSSAASAAKPVHIDEVGMPTNLMNNTSTCTTAIAGCESLKAMWDARLMGSCVIAQTKQCTLYDLIDDGPDTGQQSNYGLYGFNLSILPAGTAYATVATFLKGCTTVDALKATAQTVYEIVCHVSGGARYMVWNVVGALSFSQSQSSVSAASATDLFGNSIAVAISGGNKATFNLVDAVGPVILSLTN